MERYQAELGKFGDIAKHAIENDPTFVNNLQQSVAMKNLSQTITYLKAKANEVSQGQNWTVDNVKECAYVLFVLTIQSLSMDENNKVIMATSLYRRITGRTLEERNASRAAPMARSTDGTGSKTTDYVFNPTARSARTANVESNADGTKSGTGGSRSGSNGTKSGTCNVS